MGILQAVAFTAAESEAEDSGIGPGLYGLLVLVFLIVALFLLYRSLRKQIRKVDFDPEGVDDAERMRGHREPPDR
ncbi:hypothetical protein [Jiangella sp. DSM 45060]|uniref:hypothetical protein n=1 Tax=Jiangella sp. DSM 45060 TaxID=1798224 RepID=UPI00087A81F2|nr:hypothetical protein [Jiangella sp. DSM 45060]SDT56097.1 hypothetical protein SAMN04515669_4773 [Jiangella sp. DSM 45060]